MARYFLHLRDGRDETLDPEGSEYSDMEAVRQAVLLGARDLIAGDVQQGVIDFRFRLEAENEAGEIVYSLPFEQAVRIVADA
jgi:hypothetical protein